MSVKAQYITRHSTANYLLLNQACISRPMYFKLDICILWCCNINDSIQWRIYLLIIKQIHYYHVTRFTRFTNSVASEHSKRAHRSGVRSMVGTERAEAPMPSSRLGGEPRRETRKMKLIRPL